MNGSYSKDGVGLGLVLTTPKEEPLKYTRVLTFWVPNNNSYYRASTWVDTQLEEWGSRP